MGLNRVGCGPLYNHHDRKSHEIHNTVKLALLSDIHSNLEALTKAMELVDQAGVDKVICLGDIVGYGANPNECIGIIRERCSVVLKGNHDLAAVDISETEFFSQPARIAALWTNKQLSPGNADYLRSLPFSSAEGDLLFVHASPSHPEEWEYIVNELDARQTFKSFKEKVCFVGHSHIPGVYAEDGAVRELNRDQRYVINVGSVGQPRDGDPRLAFGMFDTDRWNYESIRSSYDAEQARKKILNAGLPSILGDRLRVGL